jgi:hypothetical protein
MRLANAPMLNGTVEAHDEESSITVDHGRRAQGDGAALGAFDRARAYVERFGVLPDVVVIDGVRYGLYSASKDFASAAYTNLARLKPSALNLITTIKRP